MQPHAPKDRRNPLVVNGTAIVPNVTRVVSRAQHLQFYYEVYDAGTTGGPSPALSVATTVTFFRGMTPVLETLAIEAHAANDAARGAVIFHFDVEPQDLEPGLYTCQVNIIDQLRGAFAFPRFELYVRP